MQGQLDTELNSRGIAQAATAADVLSERKPALIVSSDLVRAACTASALAERVGLPVRHDERLRETHLGQWQGMGHAEVEKRWPGGLWRWRTDAEWAPPGGETRVQVAARGVAAVRELENDAWTDRPVILVAHGALIAAVTAALLKLPVDRWSALGGLGNCHWVELSATTHGWRLEAWNAGGGLR